MGLVDRASALNLMDSTARMTYSEPLVACRRPDYFKADVIKIFITPFFMCMPLLTSYTSPGRDMS